MLSVARHQIRQGRPRVVTYNEDEEFHRQRIENGRRKKADPAFPPESPSNASGDDTPSQAATPLPVPTVQTQSLPPPPAFSERPAQPMPPLPQTMQQFPTSTATHSLLNRRPSENSDSDSSDEDDSDDEFDPRAKAYSNPKPTSNRTVSASGAITASPTGIVKKVEESPPSWIEPARLVLAAKYPKDSFGVVPKVKTSPDAPQEWRIKCHDW